MSKLGATATTASSVGSMIQGMRPQMASLTMVGRIQRDWRPDLIGLAMREPRFHINRRQQEQISSVARAARQLTFSGASAQFHLLSGFHYRRSAAFEAAVKVSTSYGPVVVTPEGPTPSPPSQRRSPSREGSMPDTTTQTGDGVLLEDVWEDVMDITRFIAQHHRTKVIVHFIGSNSAELIIGGTKIAVGSLILRWVGL